MFFTGVFDLESCSTAKKIHDKDPWDDDVLSTLEDIDKDLFRDGYVSNTGNVVTIYIGNANIYRIDDVKKWFSLNQSGIEVLLRPFNGWNNCDKSDKQIKSIENRVSIFKREHEDVKLPEIIGATFLSLEEVLKYAIYIPDACMLDPRPWYLRTAADEEEEEEGGVYVCDGIFEDEVDYFPVYPDEDLISEDNLMYSGPMMRPALRLASPSLSNGEKLEPGDKVTISEISFTYLGDCLLLSDIAIDGEPRFDEETNDYDNSNAKCKVESWLEDVKRQRCFAYYE